MIVSIDIGTSYSSLSMLGKDGKPVPVAIGEDGTVWGSKTLLPSAVFVEDSGNILVGQAAMRSRLRKPECFRMEFKRNLGEDTPLLLGGRSFRVEELYTELLLHMKACVKRITNEDIELAYLTCPATYRKDKKERLISAAKAAGLFQVELVPEPTAAAMSYVADGYVKDGETLLVYDFGGGTFDAALIQYKDGAFLPLGEPLGLPRCGGVDMDRLIYQDMMKAVDPDALAMLQKKQEKYLRFAGKLSENAVSIKRHLSSAQTATEFISLDLDEWEYVLDREHFEQMIAPMVSQTIHVCEDALTSAGLEKSGLSAVVLVGGTSRVPLVQQMVQQFAGKVPVYVAPDVDLAVVQGALSYRQYKRAEVLQEKQGNTQSDGVTVSYKTEEKPTPQKSDATILALVEKDSKTGFIDQTGKLVIPYMKWFYVWSFSEGLACVGNSYFSCGFIDKTGKLVIPHRKWEYAEPYFSEGLTHVSYKRWGGIVEYSAFINKSGNTVISSWDRLDSFSEGLAPASRGDKSGYHYGYINKLGELVIPCQWDKARQFFEGLARVEKLGKWGYIDKTGKLVIPCRWDNAFDFSEGLAWVKRDGKWGVIDKSGNEVIPFKWGRFHNTKARRFVEGLALVRTDGNGKYGYIDKSGNVVIPCQWDDADNFSEGLALVVQDGKYGYIDKSGKLIIPCQWDDAGCFSEGLAKVRKDGKYGFINKAGELVIPCQWDNAGGFRNSQERFIQHYCD